MKHPTPVTAPAPAPVATPSQMTAEEIYKRFCQRIAAFALEQIDVNDNTEEDVAKYKQTANIFMLLADHAYLDPYRIEECFFDEIKCKQEYIDCASFLQEVILQGWTFENRKKVFCE